ncbi:hypothetical protein ACFFWD_44595 [Bradyrhizobium erythrophlei]|uniref:hypothetical protein n=1 Tax=Bradyrhizobium erythrophlei TaxID=1437360 RepID=UPI0035E650EE
MTARQILIAATMLLLATPIVPALAHGDDDNGYARREEVHDQLSGGHQRAQDEGFHGRAEHRALRDLQDQRPDNAYGSSTRSDYAPYRSHNSSYYGRPRFSAFWGR